MTQMTYPSGRVVNFNYATGGGCCNSRLASVVDQTTGTTLLSSISYNAAGDITSRTLGNGVVEAFAFNNRLQEASITATLMGGTLMNFSYDYGTSSTNTGRVLSRTDSIQPEHSANYTYDSLYRLSQAGPSDSSWGVSWTFDVWGNRLTQTPTGLATSKVGSQSFGYSNNRNTSYGYDSAGNQLNDGLHNYSFNAENQITQMDGGTAVYAYDGDGKRMKKSIGSETTYYFFGIPGLLCEFTTTNTGATAASSTNQMTYRTSDKLGTAVLLIVSNGTVIENNRTLPYGEQWLGDVSSVNDKKFTTYLRDQESGLDYAMNRYYGNTGGRFNSPDKGQMVQFLPQTLNRYVYSGNDPINHTDAAGNDPNNCHLTPDGLWTCEGVTSPAPPSGTVVLLIVGLAGEPGPGERLGEEKEARAQEQRLPPCTEAPNAPSGVSIDQNIRLASQKAVEFAKMGGAAGLVNKLLWFANMVRPGGNWDYKQQGLRFENFGNFNFGATGVALGIPEEILLRAGGAVQLVTHLDELITLVNDGTLSSVLMPPYGDEPKDQVQIQAGASYYNERTGAKPCR